MTRLRKTTEDYASSDDLAGGLSSKIDHDSIQFRVNDMTTGGLGPRMVRWTHSVLKMTLGYAADAGPPIGRNPAYRNNFRTTHIYLGAAGAAVSAVVSTIKVMSSSSSPTPGCSSANSPTSTSRMWNSMPAVSAFAAP